MTESGSGGGSKLDAEGLQVLYSPEQVALHLPTAGPTSRILAYAIDYVLTLILEFGVVVALLLLTPLAVWLQSVSSQALDDLRQSGRPEASSAFFALAAVFVLVQLVIESGYFLFFELAMQGRSPGKRVMGLRVMRDAGLPVTLRESLMRNALRIVDWLPGYYVIGLVSMVMSKQGKRLGDIAAGTVVIRLDRVERPRPLPDSEPGELSGFRFERSQIAKLGTAERKLVRQTLRRLDELEPAAAEQALERAAEALRVRLGHGPIAPGERRAFLRALLHETRER